jgi:DNA polymerase-3 subunit delta'
MNDEAANALLKTLEEPPAYVVLLLLTDRPTQVLPTIASRCQPVRFDPPAPAELAARLRASGAAAGHAEAAARLGLGDGERALVLAAGDGIALRSAAEAFARAALHGTIGAERPWLPLLELAAARGAAARASHERRLAEELEFLPRREHKRRETELGEQARRAERRAQTGALDHGLQLTGLWFRDLACVVAGAPELAHNSDRADELAADAAGRDLIALRAATELVDDARARLALNVSYDLACEALAFRLERTFKS